jgi:hypothetical protein
LTFTFTLFTFRLAKEGPTSTFPKLTQSGTSLDPRQRRP